METNLDQAQRIRLEALALAVRACPHWQSRVIVKHAETFEKFIANGKVPDASE